MNFHWVLEGPTGSDLNGFLCLATGSAIRFDCLYEFQALDNLAENDVATIQPPGRDGSDEELRAIGVLACIGH